MNEILRSVFPPLYWSFLPSFFDEPAPREDKATCDRCAMAPAAEGGRALPGAVRFRPDVKCCSFHPRLPNYLVGAILADNSPDMAEGRSRIRAKIAARSGVTPQWLAPPAKTQLLLKATRRTSFGRSLVLRCPYYEVESGLCTVWRHRESTCSTFFCRYSAGADGANFWTAMRSYLSHVESRLAEHALQRVAPQLREPAATLGELTLEDLEDRPPAHYSACWSEWEGREEELYLRCHEHVAATNSQEFEAVVNNGDGRALLDEAVRAYRQATAPTLPERLVMNSHMVGIPANGGIYVKSYSRYETFFLSLEHQEVLRDFRGDQTVAENRVRLAQEKGVSIPDDLLLTFYQARILVEPSI
ncbi:hypothetical protein [Polyangium mundeleinium]|uniref:Uncharacterized protein n=1 Tax=Polyangium mundeleinium TaxID=2995306 RepID=A0ABT5F526_9BACT|nr:hypothetical protein [Polyangium mundeleinium]MDC0749194.1 hypothetical protein [Polyangium mundeleinium]